MVKLTPKAAQQVKTFLEKEGKPGAFLRLRVMSGGCSGLSYEFEFTDKSRPADLVSETNGARLAVDPKSHRFLEGSVVDYVQTLMETGFKIKNPKATSTCSCGTSFSAEPSTPKETSFSI